MKTRNDVFCLTPMTPDDQILVELLVDGELDETNRRDLLVRLDRLEGGWKFCAISFLESQCLRESLRAFENIECFGANDQQTLFAADAASLPDVSVSDGAFPSPERAEKNKRDETSERPIFDRFDSNFCEGNVALRVATNAKSNDEISDVSSALYNPTASSGRDVPEPRIIPLRQGGYRDAFHRKLRGGSDGGGPTWRSYLASTAGGFFLAIALIGVVYYMLEPNSNVRTTEIAPIAATNAVSNPPFSDDVSPVAGLRAVEIDESAKSKPPIAAFSEAVGSAPRLNDGEPIRFVTLKSPRDQFENVAVPCVERERYNPQEIRSFNAEIPPQLVEQLRDSGGAVATKREEYRFPLDDGRVLIVPIDAFEVRFDPNVRYL